ncbi:MAG: hypothetical protein WAW07_01420 [Bacteroidales bacterium]
MKNPVVTITTPATRASATERKTRLSFSNKCLKYRFAERWLVLERILKAFTSLGKKTGGTDNKPEGICQNYCSESS